MERDSEDTKENGFVEEQLPLAGPSDQVHVQRATTNCIVPIRTLGQGAFAQVDLCHVPAGPSRKLLVRKMLVPGSSAGHTSTALPSSNLVPALKSSSACDWTREATMHRECAGCPFVLQLLAAKRCRSGKLLLLLEYAALGSLTDILAARRQQLQLQQQHRMPVAKGSENCEGTSASVEDTIRLADSGVVDTLLPLALSAVELIVEEERTDAQLRQEEATIGQDSCRMQQREGCDLHQQKPQQQQGGDERDGDDEEAPVFVAFLPELLAEAEAAESVLQQHQQQHAPTQQQLHQAVHIAAAEGAAGTDTGVACAVGPTSHEHHGLPEDTAKFFAGCILMALQWMHSKRILHRDIKPCNLLLFGDGYLKLADLGCCCQLPPGIEAAQTRTGTAAYMAPEVIGQAPYSYPVDMWSLGVTIWQMVAGYLPDWAEEQQEQRDQQQQQEWWDGHPEPPEPLLFPAHFSQELRQLLSGLLHHDSAARLKLDDVMAANWFGGFDWQALRDKTLTPPSVL